MTTITAKELVKSAKSMSQMDEKKITAFFTGFEKKQPVLYSYIIANADHIKNEDAREDFTYIFSVIWKSYDSLNGKMNEISVKDLEKKEKEHIKGWEKFATITDPKKEEAFVKTFINQPEIWDFMLDIIFPEEDQPDQSNFSEDETAISFACINLMTALLNDKMNGIQAPAKKVTKPAAKKATKPAAKKAVVKKTAKPAAKKAVKPAAKKATKPAAKKATKPVAKKVTKPAAKKAVKPAAKKATKPAPKKAVKPVAKKATKPAAKTVTKPVAKKVVKPVAKKAAKPAAKKPVAKAKKPAGKKK